MNRREALAALASTTAIPLLSACNRESNPTEAQALALLDDVAGNLLRLSPEGATSLASTPASERRFDLNSAIARCRVNSRSRTRSARDGSR
jgi:hypothetical protein